MATTEAFAERIFNAGIAAVDLMTIYLGDRLGYYRALLDGPFTAKELAAATKTDTRYAREWLEQQAVADILTVDDVAADAEERRYRLPAAHAEALTDPTNPASMAWLARIMTAVAAQAPALVRAYQTGGGVPWDAFGPDMIEGQGDQNRPVFTHELAQAWLPSVPDIHERLTAGARVADVGTGVGWSAIAIATAYPNTTVAGFDLDEPSIELARKHAQEAGVADRVTFHATDAATIVGTYDVVTMFETLHDLPHPVEVMRAMRRIAGDDGAVLVMDENTKESFQAPGDELERLFYGFSTLLCLPTSMTEPDSAALGTVLRPSTLLALAEEAGFDAPAIAPIEHDFFRFYRLQ